MTVLITSGWHANAEVSVPANTISAMASWRIPHYPVNLYPIKRNAIFPYLGPSNVKFLQPVLFCGRGWNLFDHAPTIDQWGVVGFYFNGVGSAASTPKDVSPEAALLQGYMSKSGSDWLCGINAMGLTPLTELPVSDPSFAPSAFGCAIEWKGWNDPSGPHETSDDCGDLIATMINFTQIAVDNGSYPSLSWTTNTFVDTGCGTKVATVVSSANPNGAVNLRAQ